MSVTSPQSKIPCDILILGAGVVGLATGIALLEARPDLRVIIAEKEIQECYTQDSIIHLTH